MVKSGLPTILYGIVPRLSPTEIKAALGARRITGNFPASAPTWTRRFPGIVVEIQTLCGEYGGALGSHYELPAPAVAAIEEDLRKKHPGWSATKVHRAAEESATAHKRSTLAPRNQLERSQRTADYLTLLTELTERAETIVLALVDDPQAVAEAPESRFAIDSVDAEFLWQFPMNEPLTLVR